MTQTSTPADATATVTRYVENARWADYGNDGSDTAAWAAYQAWMTAARTVQAEGVTEAAVAALEAEMGRLENRAKAAEWEGGTGAVPMLTARTLKAAVADLKGLVAAA